VQSLVEVIELNGNLTVPEGQQLMDVIGQHIKSGVSVLLVDLHQVRFADSAGLAALVKSYKMAQKAGIKLSLCSLQPQVIFLLEMTSTDGIFEIFQDRPDFYQAWSRQFPPDAMIPSMDEFTVSRVDAP
jgi:anti-sigma B factor antagonist